MKVMVNRIAMVLSIVLFSVSLIFQTAHAEIFKWVDEKGTVHFTEDPATIPEKYREKVKSRTTEEDLMSPEERARAKKQYEEEVKEKLKKEGKEYDAKELERKVKEMEERQKRERVEGKCEIVSYSQYDVNLGGGYAPEGGGPVYGQKKATCADIIIQNNSSVIQTITDKNILATTSKGNRFNPKAFFTTIGPGETYRGSICFDRRLSISRIELRGL